MLDAVRAHLVEYGYDALGIDAVAERSGVHRTTVYRRWRDVGGLLADVLAEATGDAWRPPDTGSLEGDLLALNIEVYAALTAEPPLTAALIAASFRSAPAAGALRSFWADRYDRCALLVHRAVRRGEVPAGCDPRRLLVAATAPLYHELVLLRSAPGQELAAQAARDTVAAARAGAFVGDARAGRDPADIRVPAAQSPAGTR
ncbi:TetR/AcrR family transcriptional regulator [Micromonospora sp. WMMD1102]|uniref:TetR/AcrR family transcriptional regulator n=1 Tax=Micromonospora sp. WMMD1102 TaxID=3016105 RepID=UPI0024151C17|nr:TetR/AcrR family transcriptional regulator [Micromonospora sp. WMMD1102]MDG4789990.1 TetR/AcrR family transcriptional regulator [Micromonospora sp. WMMD1102]